MVAKIIKKEDFTKSKFIKNPSALQFFEPRSEHIELINDLISDIFEEYEKKELYEPLSFSIRELIFNAWNSNIKNLIFAKNNLSPEDFKDYINGLKIFKTILNKKDLDEISKEVYNFNYWIKFCAYVSEHGVKFEIINNSPLLPIEEKNLRLRLKLAHACADLIELYNQANFETDDDKIGLAFIIFLLKKANIDYNLFRIGNIGNSLRARIEIPFSSLYVPERYKYKR